MKTRGGVDVYEEMETVLASILVGEECSALRLGPMTSGEIAASAH
jgi:hypothetical protein